MKILILTKNVIAETSFQRKLHQLGHETFSSRDILDNLIRYKSTFGIQLFPLVIISETVPNVEVEELTPILKDEKKAVLRKIDDPLNDIEGIYLPNCEFDGLICNSASKDELREQLIEFDELSSLVEYEDELYQAMSKVKIETFKASLTAREKKLFNLMYSSLGKCITREEMSKVMWPDKHIKSTNYSINNVIQSLRNKIKHSDLVDLSILSNYGKGYVMT